MVYYYLFGPFSILVNNYFQVSFSLKVMGLIAVFDAILREYMYLV